MTPPKRRQCIDCTAEGITSKRKAPHPGPRCTSHNRLVKRARSAGAWEKRLIATYGITAEDYWKIYEAQGGCCYICQRATGARKRLSVDHDHATGEVRGLLCLPCNRNVLGHFRDQVAAFQRGIDYLNNPPARAALGEKRIVPDHRLTRNEQKPVPVEAPTTSEPMNETEEAA